MAKSKRAPTLTSAGGLDWTSVRTQRGEYEPSARILAQGDPATSVMYLEKGAVRLSVLSHAGKEAVIAVLDEGHFFGEGCLVGQSQRMATATAMAPCTIVAVEKQEMVRQLHAEPRFADRFLTHMLTRNIRIEEDLIDQLFNSSGSGSHGRYCCSRVTVNPRRLPRPAAGVSGGSGRDGRHDPLAGQLLHEQVSEARIHRLQRRLEDSQLSPDRRAARLTFSAFSHRASPGSPAAESAGSNRTMSSVMLSGPPPSVACASSFFAASSGAGSRSSVAAIASFVTVSVNPSEHSSKRSPA